MPDALDSAIEQAVDDILLVADQIRAGMPNDAGSRAADRVVELFEQPLSGWMNAHRRHASGAASGAGIVATAASDADQGYSLLSTPGGTPTPGWVSPPKGAADEAAYGSGLAGMKGREGA